MMLAESGIGRYALGVPVPTRNRANAITGKASFPVSQGFCQ